MLNEEAVVMFSAYNSVEYPPVELTVGTHSQHWGVLFS